MLMHLYCDLSASVAFLSLDTSLFDAHKWGRKDHFG